MTSIGTSPGKSSWMEQHLAGTAVCRGGLGLVEEDRVRRTLGVHLKGYRTLMGGVQLEKEVDTAGGHPKQISLQMVSQVVEDTSIRGPQRYLLSP